MKEGSSQRSLLNSPLRPDVPSPSLLPERGDWWAAGGWVQRLRDTFTPSLPHLLQNLP